MSKRIFKLLFTLLLTLSFPLAVSAVVSQLVFTTTPQTIVPGVISGTLTVQLQNDSGTSNPATETMDVEFTSTSATGEFLSPTSENPVTKTISTGSANKNFRYRDSTEGVFTLSTKVTGRVSGSSWTSTQTIIVSTAASSTATSTSSTTNTTASSTQATTTITTNPVPSNSVYYIYYISAPLSAVEAKKPPQLSAGLNRLASVGSPLEFKAETDLPYLKTSIFTWNFGDGSIGRGETLSHTYKYPGDYVVVLNANLPQGEAVARANVKVALPILSIVSATPERVEIANNSSSEVSLFGRALWSGGKSFVFPQDSIVMAGKSLFIPSFVTGLHPHSANDVYITVIGDMQSDKIVKSLEEGRATEIESLQARLESLQAQLAVMPRSARTTSLSTETAVLATSSEPVVESQTASALESGWFDTVKKFFLQINN